MCHGQFLTTNLDVNICRMDNNCQTRILKLNVLFINLEKNTLCLYISVRALYVSLGITDKTLQDIFLYYCVISRDLDLNLIQN